MEQHIKLKTVKWVGSSKKDLCSFPPDVRRNIGYALHFAQAGDKHSSAKPLKGFKGAGVLEVVENFNGDTYRAVYAVRYKGTIYIIHCFQKKSKKGIETPKQEIELIKRRLKEVEELHKIKGKQ